MSDSRRNESAPDVTPLTIAYIVRPGEENEELRYSLRSLRNLPVGRVIIAGHKPEWVCNVEHYPTKLTSDRYRSSERNMLRLCSEEEKFTYFNDDFFCLKPQTTIPVWYRSTLREMSQTHPASHRTKWWRGIMAAHTQLERWGYRNPLSYELHVPLDVTSEIMVDVIERARREDARPALMKRSLYGNVAKIGGTQHKDVKLRAPNASIPARMVWVSSNDRTFRTSVFGRKIRAMFPDPSPYERETRSDGWRG